MRQYRELLNDVLAKGVDRTDRTGVGRRSMFGGQKEFDLNHGFPIVTGKFTAFKTLTIELLWFLTGNTNVKPLQEQGVKIWNEWVLDEEGNLGPIYGKQWRDWISPDGSHIDQIEKVIQSIKTNPHSTRHIVTVWNPADVDNMALPPCHTFFQFFVANGELSCQLYQRSADLFLGVPFNIASYALLTHIIAMKTGLKVGKFVHTFGDYHIYHNHFEQAYQYLNNPTYPLPTLEIDPIVAELSWEELKAEHFNLLGYQHHGKIVAPVAV